MTDYCVVVANGARARFFTLQNAKVPEIEGGPNLVEQSPDLVNPEKELPDRELWSNEYGRGRVPSGVPAHGYDDHREQHDEELVRRFARRVAEETVRMVQANSASHVVLVAQKRTLGHLRPALEPLLKTNVDVREVGKDLSKLSPTELHEHLAKENVLPRRRMPSIL